MATDHHGRTHRLELGDQSLREWDAVVLDVSEQGIVLDRSAFYPGGGGQPPDHGVLLWGGVETRIVGARRGDDLYLVPADGDPLPVAGTAVRGAVADERRSALMRTHSGLHLLSGVVFRDFGALVTGGNMQPLEARIGVSSTQKLSKNGTAHAIRPSRCHGANTSVEPRLSLAACPGSRMRPGGANAVAIRAGTSQQHPRM